MGCSASDGPNAWPPLTVVTDEILECDFDGHEPWDERLLLLSENLCLGGSKSSLSKRRPSQDPALRWLSELVSTAATRAGSLLRAQEKRARGAPHWRNRTCLFVCTNLFSYDSGRRLPASVVADLFSPAVSERPRTQPLARFRVCAYRAGCGLAKNPASRDDAMSESMEPFLECMLVAGVMSYGASDSNCSLADRYEAVEVERNLDSMCRGSAYPPAFQGVRPRVCATTSFCLRGGVPSGDGVGSAAEAGGDLPPAVDGGVESRLTSLRELDPADWLSSDVTSIAPASCRRVAVQPFEPLPVRQVTLRTRRLPGSDKALGPRFSEGRY